MNSHNKPEKKAIHANNQLMEVAFHSAPGLSTSLQAVGFEMDFAQLSWGRLEGTFRLGGSWQLPVFIHPNQSRPAASGQPTPWGDAPQLPRGTADHRRQHRA